MSPRKVVMCDGFAVCVSKAGNGGPGKRTKWRKAWSASPEWKPSSDARCTAFYVLKSLGLAGVDYVLGVQR